MLDGSYIYRQDRLSTDEIEDIDILKKCGFKNGHNISATTSYVVNETSCVSFGTMEKETRRWQQRGA